MDFSAIKDLYIGSTPVQSAWLNGSKVWGRKPAVDEQSIRDAMILWYDLKKQGATNESMASTPELVNHAYDPDKENVIDWTQFSTRGDGVQQFSIEITSTTNYWVVNQAAYHRTNSIPSFYVEVSGLPEGHTINYFYGNGSDERQTYVVSYNGIHKLPACRVSPNVTTATGWFIDPNNPTGQTVADLVGTTITQVNPTFNATCYNFAWSGMSGVGGFDYPLYPNVFSSDGFCNIPNNRHYTRLTDVSDTTYSIKFKVSKMSNGKTLYVRKVLNDGDSTSLLSIITENGEYSFTIDSGYLAVYPSEGRNPEGVYNADIDIQLVPLYPNALVSDGVDDYCLVEGLPLLNKEDGYTVIVKRKLFTDFSTLKRAVGFLSKRTNVTYGAFVIEKIATTVNTETVYSFSSTYNDVNIDKEEHIVVTTKNSYDGQHITSGTSNDNDFLIISAGNNNNGTIQEYTESAIYSLLLFNRDLTTEEIEWVKTNLIESEQ